MHTGLKRNGGMKTGEPMELLSFCGLYCGNCTGYKRGLPLMARCSGCLEGGGPPNCGIRDCSQDKGYRTCAECDRLEACGLFDGFAHKVARVVFGSDKRGNLVKIRELGLEAFVQNRLECGRV
jgi:hypothetical protein